MKEYGNSFSSTDFQESSIVFNMNRPRIDLTGQKYGRLTVLGCEGYRIQNNGGKRWYWKCKCDCGNETVVRGDCLRTGNTTSCGCYCQETRKKNKRFMIDPTLNMAEQISKTITYNGVTRTVTEWAEFLGMSYSTLWKRIKAGWNIKDVLTSPISGTTLDERKNRGAVALTIAIFRQAANDYRDLKVRNLQSKMSVGDGDYSRKEIEKFFKSEWCRELLKNSNCNFNGNDLIKILKEETTEKSKEYLAECKGAIA